LKKKLNIILTLCCLCAAILWKGTGAYAQTNLVPNWSFEEYNSCPIIGTADCNISYSYIAALKNWYCAMTYLSTPDYFNNCSPAITGFKNGWGYQKARTGNGYVGGYMSNLGLSANLEYIQCTLKDSLKPNINYCVQFYVNRADKIDYPISQYGAVFSHTQLAVFGGSSPLGPFPVYINLLPQVKNPLGSFIKDSINWTKVEGAFIASGGERYLTLGCFGAQSLTDTLYDPVTSFSNNYATYYYLDDVSVEAVTNAQAGRDKTINCGDTVVIGADSAVGAEYKWFPKTGLNFDSIAFPLATPTITTKYVLQKKQCSVITYDTVFVTVANNCPTIIHDDEFIIPNVFTPNADGVNDVWLINLGFGNTLNTLSIFNRWGILVGSNPSPSGRLGGASWDGRTTSGIECSPGVYYYTLEYTNILGQQKKVNGYVSLFR
jgi:gliding motility-associated-like protein